MLEFLKKVFTPSEPIDFKELINDLFNNDSCYSCYSCCNNTNEKNTIIIPAKDNYIIKPITAKKNKYSNTYNI